MSTAVPFHKGEWMESGQDPRLSPTVFLVEQPANTTLKTHFHGENQFQVFVRGSGSIGRETISPMTVHYAGAYTGYGPLLSGPEGLFYFTIRAVFRPAPRARSRKWCAARNATASVFRRRPWPKSSAGRHRG